MKVRDRFSGNGRDVLKLVKKSIKTQNLRLARAYKENRRPSDADQWVIRQEDLKNWEPLRAPHRRQIGFIDH